MDDSPYQAPKFFLKLLKWFCDPEIHPYVEGDLIEHFENHAQSKGVPSARARLVRDVILLFRPGIIRSFIPSKKLKFMFMFKHNLLISTRGLLKDRVSFFVSICSLTAGLTSVILIFLWVNDELAINRFHNKSDRLYQVFLNEPSPLGIETSPSTQVLLAEHLKSDFPEIEHAASVIPYDWFEGERFIISDGNDKIFTSRNQFASKDYFKLFSFPIIYGDANTMLDEPRSVAISEDLAIKLFGNLNPIGESLEWQHPYYGGTYKVSGVFANISKQSTQQFDAVFPFDIIKEDEGEEWLEWTESDPYTFFSLKSNANSDELGSKLASLLQNKQASLQSTLVAQRYADTYLYDQYRNGVVTGGRILYVRLFSLIGIVILFVASFNFMILSTARAKFKMKQIGIKKSMGASRKSLIQQYFTESFLVTITSTVLALPLTLLILPQFGALSGKDLALKGSGLELLSLAAFIIVTGLASGIYPALHLSGFNPVAALKGNVKNPGGQIIRKSLIVLQFSVSSFLIVIAIVIASQIDLIQSKDLGFKKENLIWFTMGKPNQSSEGELTASSIQSFLAEVKGIPGVKHVSNFAHNVLGAYGTTTGLSWPEQEAPLLIAQVSGGYEFIETLGIEVVTGRSFSRDFKTDTEKLVLNEAAVKEMQLISPIGKVVDLWGQKREIIGVVKDFHIDQLYKEIMPVFIKLDLDDFAPHVMVKLTDENQKATVQAIEAKFSNFFVKGYPFEFKYLDDNYEEFYEQELRVGQLAKYATGIAIFLSCLGLFAFAGFILQKRMRELAIRKTIGSGAFRLIKLLLTQFLTLVLISIVIAAPFSFLASRKWLDNFAFHIELSLWHFMISIMLVVALTLASIAFHTIKGLNVNVVNYLNKER